MEIFIISDTHFFHTNIIKYTGRPFGSAYLMNETIISNWNKVVSKEDIVLHLGDFGLGTEEELKELKDRLNGTIFLIRGNHDHQSKIKDLGFIIIEDYLIIGNKIFSHYPIAKDLIPYKLINIHGHIHEKESLNGINVSVEKTNYAPINIKELDNFIKINS